MADNFSDYKIQFKLSNKYHLGRIIGDDGRRRKEIERLTGAEVEIDEVLSDITIKGSRSEVIAAENKVIEILESQTFVAYLSDTIIGQIMGRAGKQLAKLRQDTNANIKISPQKIANQEKLKLLEGLMNYC